MGGFGSGHTYRDKKRQREDCWPLSADRFSQAGFFTQPGKAFATRFGRQTWGDGARIGLEVRYTETEVVLVLNFAMTRTDRAAGNEVRETFAQTVLVEP